MRLNQEEISWQQLLAQLPEIRGAVDVIGLNPTASAYALAQVYRACRSPLLAILPSLKAAEHFYAELRLFSGADSTPILFFPPYNLMPFKFMAYHNETAARRIQTLYELVESQSPPVVVTSLSGVIQRLLPKAELMRYAELIVCEEEIHRDDLIAKLVAGGYSRVAMVEELGDFSVRGGILDVYAPSYPDPLRIEFYGDLVESIRLFSVDTQRTLKNLEEVVLLPAREAILQPSRLNDVLGRIRIQAAEQGLSVTKVREIVQRIKAEGIFPGMESLLPLIFKQTDTLFDYLPRHTLPVMIEPAALRQAAVEYQVQTEQNYHSANSNQRLVVTPESLYLKWTHIQQRLSVFDRINFKPLEVDPAEGQDAAQRVCRTGMSGIEEVQLSLNTARTSDRPLQPLADWLSSQQQTGTRTLILCRRPSHIGRLEGLLSGYGVRTVKLDAPWHIPSDTDRVGLGAGAIETGFAWPDAAIAMIGDEEIFVTGYRTRKTPARAKVAELLSIEDLKIGDAVVHDEHGIGRYEGLVKLGVDRSFNDYLLVVYRDDDKLYLPVERMNLVHKYMGVDGVTPVLDKMGGVTWEKIRGTVKRSAEKIAGELLKLYAARRVQKGHAFGALDTYFRDFEDGFPYEETPDQRRAIEEVLDDMRKPAPMDRLVCGDVGYGKTEVALRAAFLAVSEAKQVAVLVPTTVLAEQHYATFCERFKQFPVQVESLNRFRNAKEQSRIVADIKEGRVDIVIGTHRLLQKDVKFKDLGLLILDEEQRFGVKHKEKIKRLRETVDVLTLTATPIPRTLHLSLLGIRDISLISTPPEQRRPIATYITEWDDIMITEAIRKELSRKGQIFFVHNKVQSLERIAGHLKRLVPEVRLVVAHGQMPEDRLEKAMLDFMQQRVDMLVCTTIVESGLDVSSANTIIINRADHFGLAQIYQLRGRVGRAEEQAYAYLVIPNETVLTKTAQKRLKVLMEYSDLGSGFQIAMSDLKIRGGGTILGASQSGHIAAVGYDMFLRLMENSISELKGEPQQEVLEPEINLQVSAFLPEQYIVDIDQRLSIYRRLARMGDIKEIGALKTELEDRFGQLPDEASNLLLKIMLKVLATRAGCARLDLTDNQLQLHFSETYQKRPFGIVDMVAAADGKYRFSPDGVFKATLTGGTPNALIAQAKNILIEINRHVNQ